MPVYEVLLVFLSHLYGDSCYALQKIYKQVGFYPDFFICGVLDPRLSTVLELFFQVSVSDFECLLYHLFCFVYHLEEPSVCVFQVFLF